MPGPRFGGKKNWFEFLGKHSQKIILGLIVVLLAVGGFYMYKNYRQRQELLKPALEEILNSNSPSPSENTAQKNEPQQAKATAASAPAPVAQSIEIVRKDNGIAAKAGRGSGATHLARSALQEYLKDKADLRSKLLPEHKIYIEDYLQKKTARGQRLKIGQEINFSDELINDAIEKAQTLKDNQIKNLHKYVVLVPSLT